MFTHGLEYNVLISLGAHTHSCFPRTPHHTVSSLSSDVPSFLVAASSAVPSFLVAASSEHPAPFCRSLYQTWSCPSGYTPRPTTATSSYDPRDVWTRSSNYRRRCWCGLRPSLWPGTRSRRQVGSEEVCAGTGDDPQTERPADLIGVEVVYNCL